MKEKQFIVSAGIIRKGEKVLIAQRKKDSVLEANKWEFPGGKVEYLEHPRDCLVREIMEELGINIKVQSLFNIDSHVYEKDGEKYHIILITFLAEYLLGEVKNKDCQDSKWVCIEELGSYDFAQADKNALTRFVNGIGTQNNY